MLNCEPPNHACVPEPEVTVEELIHIPMDQITRFEIKTVLKKVRNNKAAGIDNLHCELLKIDPERIIKELFVIFNEIWKREVVPQEWTQCKK